MKPELHLDQMTTEEKLEVIEEIWEDLRRNPASIPIPAWHEEALREREQSVQDGSARFVDLEEAMRELRERLK